MLETPNYIELIALDLELKNNQVKIVLDLVAEWATVPFIARYRKEMTENLDENQIRWIIELQKKLENLFNAKNTAINWIEEKWMMTEILMQNIINAKTLKEVEEIYKPYKSKRKTKAMIAIEKWFQVVADNIKSWNLEIPQNLLDEYPETEIIEWAIEIISAEFSANSELRHYLIEELEKHWIIKSFKKTEKSLEKLNEKDKEQIPKFEIYFDFSTKINRIKPYQVLALNRWEKIWILNVKFENDELIFDKLQKKYLYLLSQKNPIEELDLAFKSGYKALFSSVENEIRATLWEMAQDSSIEAFQKNLKSLLMTKPSYNRKILAIDPGFRAGCKVVLLDELWEPLVFDKVFLHKKDELKTKLKKLITKYSPDVIVIWNGTWTVEMQKLTLELFSKDIFVVNESWASVYSVSKIWEEEFPDLDSLDRWTISIWRRFIDPLSELVKVPVWSIGVGMYQHDMPEKKLEEKLGYVVEDSVNEVWINVNTASVYLLNHISWIDKRQAKKIYKNKPYSSRSELEKVLWEKAFQQAIWFLRVPESAEILDNTDIHPDQYELAKYVIENNISKIDDKCNKLYENATQDTIDFINESYQNREVEKRINFTHSKVEWEKNLEDLKAWDIIDWIVRNVVAFGAFVDIWTKNDWLVHISQIADKFVSDPNDILKVWDKVKVKIINIDEKTKKIQLSMKWL